MRRIRNTFTAMAIGGSVGLAIGFAAMLGTAPADVKDVAPVVSNAAAKQDRTEPAVRRTAAASELEITGTVGGTVTMRDADGQVVYRSDPALRETVVARDALIPTTLRGLHELFDGHPMAGRSDAARLATIDREGFRALIASDTQ